MIDLSGLPPSTFAIAAIVLVTFVSSLVWLIRHWNSAAWESDRSSSPATVAAERRAVIAERYLIRAEPNLGVPLHEVASAWEGARLWDADRSPWVPAIAVLRALALERGDSYEIWHCELDVEGGREARAERGTDSHIQENPVEYRLDDGHLPTGWGPGPNTMFHLTRDDPAAPEAAPLAPTK